MDSSGGVYRVLRDVMEAMAQGLAITVAPQHTMLTTQEAADLLGILSDVLSYRESARIERRARLADMMDSAEKHDLHTATATPKPTR